MNLLFTFKTLDLQQQHRIIKQAVIDNNFNDLHQIEIKLCLNTHLMCT